MELISSKTSIPFMKSRFVAFLFSASLIGLAIFTWINVGPDKYGVDFLGGTELVIKFEKPVDAGSIRSALVGGGIVGAVVQKFNPLDEDSNMEYSVRLKEEKDSNISDTIKEALNGIKENSYTILKQDFVGPVIGEQIRTDGVKALVAALVCILLYISFRFEWRFAVGAITALVHDVIVTTGLFLLSDREISVAVLAALEETTLP